MRPVVSLRETTGLKKVEAASRGTSCFSIIFTFFTEKVYIHDPYNLKKSVKKIRYNKEKHPSRYAMLEVWCQVFSLSLKAVTIKDGLAASTVQDGLTEVHYTIFTLPKA